MRARSIGDKVGHVKQAVAVRGMKLSSSILVLALIGILFGVLVPRPRVESLLKSDEQIVFLPAIGRMTTNGGWEVSVSGFVYEQESRPGARPLLRKYLGLDDETMSADETKLFEERIRRFLIDAESGKRIAVRIGDAAAAMEITHGDGHFSGTVSLSASEATHGELRLEAILPAGDARKFSAPVHLVPPRGVSVVSDIDDTIKVSNVRKRRELLLNTFVRPFKPVPGIAETYRRWASNSGTAFHYVSASPWQLAPVLGEFLTRDGFPAGTLQLRTLRWRKELLGGYSPDTHKRTEIGRLLAMFPEREFVLVGDSGERDPEIYGALTRENPGRIRAIYIRNVTDEPATSGRYTEAFKGLPAERWKVFKEPGELPDRLGSTGTMQLKTGREAAAAR